MAGERTFRRTALVVAAVSTAAFAWFVTLGRPDLAQYRGFGEVFDIQARALLHGHLDVPSGSLAFEGFVVDGRTYAYFGIFPSLLRLPLFLVTDRFDGRLSALSMLVAYVVALWAAFTIVHRVRALLRPGAPWTRPGLVVAAALLAVVGLGSNLLFLASGAWVYHEASLWGAAGVLASFAATLRYLDRRRLRSVVAAGLWAGVAWTSRGSVGLAPSLVLGLLALAQATGHPWLAALAPPPESAESAEGTATRPGGSGGARPGAWASDRRAGAALLVAASVGALIFATINTAKFGGPTTLPMDKQVASAHPWPDRRRALEIYDGSLFSPRLIPSVVYQSLRPDLVAPTGVWPFLRFTGKRPPVPSGLVFDTVEPSAGLTVTSPLLLGLAVVGAVASARRRRPPADATGRAEGADPGTAVHAAMLRPFLLGGLAAAYAPLTIAFVAQRYLTDALPLLVVAAAGGLAVFDSWAERRGETNPRLPRVAAGAVVVLAVGGILATAAVTWSFQRFEIPPDPGARAAGLRTQVAVAEVLGRPPTFDREPERLPAHAAGTGLVVLGDCLGLYVGQAGGDWAPIEVSAGAGHHRLGVRFAGSPDADRRALITVGSPADHVVVAASGPADSARLTLVRNGVAGRPGLPVDLSGGQHEVDVAADPAFAWIRVTVDGREAGFEPVGAPVDRTATLGRDPYGTVPPLATAPVSLPTPTPTCDALVAASH